MYLVLCYGGVHVPLGLYHQLTKSSPATLESLHGFPFFTDVVLPCLHAPAFSVWSPPRRTHGLLPSQIRVLLVTSSLVRLFREGHRPARWAPHQMYYLYTCVTIHLETQPHFLTHRASLGCIALRIIISLVPDYLPSPSASM